MRTRRLLQTREIAPFRARLHLGRGAQVGHGVRLFPGEFGQLPAEVPVARGLAVDGPLEVETLADEVGPKVKDLAHGLGQHLVRDVAGAARGDEHTHRVGHADAIGDLHLAFRATPRARLFLVR